MTGFAAAPARCGCSRGTSPSRLLSLRQRVEGALVVCYRDWPLLTWPLWALIPALPPACSLHFGPDRDSGESVFLGFFPGSQNIGELEDASEGHCPVSAEAVMASGSSERDVGTATLPSAFSPSPSRVSVTV